MAILKNECDLSDATGFCIFPESHRHTNNEIDSLSLSHDLFNLAFLKLLLTLILQNNKQHRCPSGSFPGRSFPLTKYYQILILSVSLLAKTNRNK